MSIRKSYYHNTYLLKSKNKSMWNKNVLKQHIHAIYSCALTVIYGCLNTTCTFLKTNTYKIKYLCQIYLVYPPKSCH